MNALQATNRVYQYEEAGISNCVTGLASSYCWPYFQPYQETATVLYHHNCGCGQSTALRAAGIEALLAGTLAALKLPKGGEEGKRLLAAMEALRKALA